MKKTKTFFSHVLIGCSMLASTAGMAQAINGHTYTKLISQDCTIGSTGRAVLQSTFSVTSSLSMGAGTYRWEVRMQKGHWNQQFNTSQVTNTTSVSSITSPTFASSGNVWGTNATYFSSIPTFTVFQNGTYRATSVLQRFDSPVWTDVYSTPLQTNYVGDDTPPIVNPDYFNEVAFVDELDRAPYLGFKINNTTLSTGSTPTSFVTCSSVPLNITDVTGALGTANNLSPNMTLTVTKGTWSGTVFTATATASTYTTTGWNGLNAGLNLNSLFTSYLNNYAGYLQVTLTLPNEYCDGAPVSKSYVISIGQASFLGNYSAVCYIVSGCTTSDSKTAWTNPSTIPTAVSTNTIPNSFKCDVANGNGWQSCKKVGINNFTFVGSYTVEVYQADPTTGNRIVISGSVAPNVYARIDDAGITGSLDFNEFAYGAGYDGSTPFGCDLTADANGVTGNGNFFIGYYNAVKANATNLAAMSARVWCVDVRIVSPSGCVVNKKTYFKIVNNGVNNNGWQMRMDNSDEGNMETETSWSIFPNPSTDVFNISIENGNGTAQLEVFDYAGKLMKAEAMSGFEHRIDLSGYAKGIYFVKLNSNGQSTTKKIVLQ